MFKRKVTWYKIFESKEEFVNFFGQRNTVLFKNTFGEIMLAREEESFYAFTNRCPHQNKSLEGCSIQDGFVICPWHKYAFSCETGRGHALYLEKYPIKFDEEGVFVGKEGWSLF